MTTPAICPPSMPSTNNPTMLRTTIGARYSAGVGVGTCENWSGS